HETPAELFTRVDDVGARRSRGQRAITDLLEIAAGAEVEGERDDLGTVSVGKGGNGPGRLGIARFAETRSSPLPPNGPRSHLTSFCARRGSGAMTSTVSSPAMVPIT